MSEVNHCGNCTLCCKVMGIKELAKPVNTWCGYCDKGKGCKIYDHKPPSCTEYACMWLQMQEEFGTNTRPDLRPDKCKVVITATQVDGLFSVHNDPNVPHAWKAENVEQFIGKLAQSGCRFVVTTPNNNKKILVQKGKNNVVTRTEINVTDEDENGTQWLIK